APHFLQLESLNASSCQLGDVAADGFSAAGFAMLKEGDLSSNRMTDSGISTIAKSKALTNVVKLDLSRKPFGIQGAKAGAAARFSKLEAFSLGEVHLGPEGAAALCAGKFPKLTRLWVSTEQVGPKGKAALLKRFGDQVLGCF